MKKPTFFLNLKRWHVFVFGAVGICAFVGLYLLQLGWPGQLTPAEAATASANKSVHLIIHNPLGGVYKVLDYVWLHLSLRPTASARLAAVCLALVAAAVFYVLAKRWHGRVSAVYATVLFATSTWLLHVGRLGNSEILFILTPLSLLLLASWLNTTERHNWAVLLFALVSGLALFTPGGVWFVVAMTVLLAKILWSHFNQAKFWASAASVIILLIMVGGLAYTLWRKQFLVRPWLGLPSTFDTPFTMLKHLVGSISYLVVRGPDLSGAWLAHTPVLDVGSTVLLVFGLALYVKHVKNLRTLLLLIFFIIGSLLVALNGAVALGFVIGTVYLVVATGLAYFQHRWLAVFPINPIARTLASVLVLLVVASIVTFHVQRYFVAWQRSPATQQIFQKSSAPRSDLIQ